MVRYGTVWFKRALLGLCCRCCCVGRWRLRGRCEGGAWEKVEGGGGEREWRDRGRRADGKMEGVDVAKTKKQTLLTYIISNTRSLDVPPNTTALILYLFFLS